MRMQTNHFGEVRYLNNFDDMTIKILGGGATMTTTGVLLKLVTSNKRNFRNLFFLYLNYEFL